MASDQVSHYARPVVLSLLVTAAPQPAVTLGGGA